MRYSIEIKSSAEKDMGKLPRDIRRRAAEKILLLEENPRPPGAKHLEAPFEGYRIRIGDWRVLYVVDDGSHKVFVYSVGHRREAYRKGR